MSNLRTDQQPPSFISKQVKDGDYFFLNLNPSPQSELVVVAGGSESCFSNYFIERSDFGYYGIEYIAQGSCRVVLENKSYDLRVGAVFCYGPNTSHSIENVGDTQLVKFFVDLQGTKVAELLWSTFLKEMKPHQIAQYRWIHDIFRQLQDAGKKGGDNVQKICRLLIELLMERIEQLSFVAQGNISQAYATYERCRSYLNTHFSSLKSINDLANECNVSSAYLARLFKRYTKTPPSNLLLHYKMNYAAELLMAGDHLVKEVADKVGIDDQYYFSRSFKKFFGVSPKNFSNTLSRSQNPASTPS
jgi:AraC-like DNA-binding protein